MTKSRCRTAAGTEKRILRPSFFGLASAELFGLYFLEFANGVANIPADHDPI